MKDLKAGARVRWIDGDRTLTGTVVGPARSKLMTLVRIDAGGETALAKNQLRPALDRVLILESRLDASLRSTRACGPLYSNWLQQAHNIRPMYERIHTSLDLNDLVITHAPSARIVLIACHGKADSAGTRLQLSREEVHLRRRGRIVADQPWLQSLAGKVVILSCCEVGSDTEAMKELARRNRLELLVAYSEAVYDRFAIMSDILTMEGVLADTRNPQQLVTRARALAEMLHRQGFDYVPRHERERMGAKLPGPVMRVFGPR
jgi:hypothetical protein